VSRHVPFIVQTDGALGARGKVITEANDS